MARVIAILTLAASLAEAQPEEAIPPPPQESMTPAEAVVAPLLEAAERDLAAGRVALALARTTAVAEVLPEGVPLRVRADGLRVLAHQRMPVDLPPPPPAPDEIYAPLVAQAELDIRASQPQIAIARLDLALGRLPEGPALTQRARALRNVAMQAFAQPPPPMFVPPPMPAPLAPPPPRDPNERGTGERVELYITAGMFGALSGSWLCYMASNNTANAVEYVLTTVAGAGLLAVGVLSLDLTMNIPSGVMPTISSSIRFGLAHGMLAFGLRLASGEPGDGPLDFTLVWGGMATGTLTGLAIGFGATPTVREERFVESLGIWGAMLSTSIAMLTNYEDPVVGLALTLGGLDLGLLIGIGMAAAGVTPSIDRTLWMDLGFLAGSGVGALIPYAVYAYGDPSTFEYWPFGLGMLIGGVGGWLLTFLLTLDYDAAPAAAADVHLGIAPLENGAAVTASGTF